jgi:hypothetical protein
VGGISHILLFLNLFGDVIKMYYFVLKVHLHPLRTKHSSSSFAAAFSSSSIPSSYSKFSTTEARRRNQARNKF